MQALKTSILLAALAASAAASAADKTTSASFDITPNGMEEITDWSHGVSVPKFDSTLGTLKAVSFSIDWTATLKASITSRGLDPSTVDPHHYVDLYITNYDVFGMGSGNFLTPMGNPDNIVDHAYGSTTLSKDVEKTFDYTGKGTVDAAFDQSYLSLFNGASDPTLWFWANGYLNENGSGSYDASNDTMVGMKGMVSYTYAPKAVPEPASMAALGLGVLGLVRRRRQGGAK